MRYLRGFVQKSPQRGFGILEVLVAGAVGIAVILSLIKVVTGNWKVSKKSEAVLDQSILKGYLVDRVSCAKSLAAAVPRCPAGSYITLKDANDKPVVPDVGGVIGRSFVRVRCAGDGLDIRTAELSPSGLGNPTAMEFDGPNTDAWYRKDPHGSDRALNWLHPRATLFAPGRSELCGHMFGAVDASAIAARVCPNKQILREVNFYKNSVECLPMPPACPSQTALSWNRTSFICVPSPFDSHIKDNLIGPAIQNNNKKVEAAPAVCVTAERKAGGSISGGGGKVSPIDSGKNWGMSCDSPFVYFGCSIAGVTNDNGFTYGGEYADWDIRTESNGCSTDNEEKSGSSILAISCCKPGDPNSVP